MLRSDTTGSMLTSVEALSLHDDAEDETCQLEISSTAVVELAAAFAVVAFDHHLSPVTGMPTLVCPDI